MNLRGGVSPRGTLLRGQSIIEYVLIIAIIGLVIVFAGPGVAGAIRNQFNLVGNTVNSGTTGGVEGGGASGGGSIGADSATVQAAVAKDAKDWTLDEQKAVAEDIAAKGEASPAYAKAKAAMDAGTKFTMKLTNGKTLEYRIIGINHDDLADGGGKAGLTFLATTSINRCEFNPKSTDGGWEKSELRGRLNTGDLWNLMPSDFQSKVVPVTKLTNNERQFNKDVVISATTDKLFLLSYFEITGAPWNDETYKSWISDEGTQYEAFKGKVMNGHSGNDCLIAKEHLDGRGRWNGSYAEWWQRSIYASGTDDFYLVNYVGFVSSCSEASEAQVVCPAFCF